MIFYIKITNYNMRLKFESTFINFKIPNISIGDTITLEIKIEEAKKIRIQNYSGIVISKKNTGLNKIITVRKVMQGIGIERCFLIYSPKINLIQIKNSSKVKRSKLYYLRKLFTKVIHLKENME